MKVGIQLPEIERVVPWSEHVEMARIAEEVGFASIWLGDHVLYDKPEGPVGPWECWTLLAALAAVTERALLGPLVSPTGFRNPALLAKMAGTVDEVSGGRLVLGLGSGWNQREYEAFGFEFENRVSRFEEEFAIIVDLIRNGAADFAGRYNRADRAVLVPPARPDMPIMIGSTGPRMLSITASEMDWWNEWWSRFDNSPDKLDPLLSRLDSALREADRDPSEVVKSVALLVRLDGGGGRLMGSVIDTPPITGSMEQIADQVMAFASKVDHVQLIVDPITTDSIERLAPVVARAHGTAA